jgi:hypothetical protein
VLYLLSLRLMLGKKYFEKLTNQIGHAHVQHVHEPEALNEVMHRICIIIHIRATSTQHNTNNT